MTRRIAIVPARGGSKRIPHKNIRPFCGRPIIAYSLNAARQSGLFDAIHVSTDCPVIAATVRDLGFPIEFMRPAELADDHTPIMPVLRHVVETFETLGRSFDEVALIMACAPLIEADDLIAAAGLLAEVGHRKAVLSVAPYPVPVEWAFRRSRDGLLDPVQPGMFAVRSQDLEPKYYDTGQFCFFPVSQVVGGDYAGNDQGYVGQVMPKQKAIDIDDLDDWVLVEALFRTLRHNGAG